MSDRNEQTKVRIITSSDFGLESEEISVRKVSDSRDHIANDSKSVDDAIKATLEAIYQAIKDVKTNSLYNRLFSLLNAEIKIESVEGSISFMRFLYRFDALKLTTLIEKVIKEEDPIIQDALVACLQENLVYVKDGKDENIGLFEWTNEIRAAALVQIDLLKGYATTLKSELQTQLTKDKAAEATKIPEDMINLINDRDREALTPEGKEPSSSEKLQNVVLKMRLLHTLHRSDKLFYEKRIGGKTWYGIAAKIAACILLPPYGFYRLYKSMENKNSKTYSAKYPKTLQRVYDIDTAAGFNYGQYGQREGVAPHFRGDKLFDKPVAVAGKEASLDSKEKEGESESRKQSKSVGK